MKAIMKKRLIVLLVLSIMLITTLSTTIPALVVMSAFAIPPPAPSAAFPAVVSLESGGASAITHDPDKDGSTLAVDVWVRGLNSFRGGSVRFEFDTDVFSSAVFTANPPASFDPGGFSVVGQDIPNSNFASGIVVVGFSRIMPAGPIIVPDNAYYIGHLTLTIDPDNTATSTTLAITNPHPLTNIFDGVSGARLPDAQIASSNLTITFEGATPPTMHTITWQPNGGTWGTWADAAVSGTNRTTQVQEGNSPTTPPASAISRANYTLNGWTRDTGVFSDPVNSSITMTADWAPIMHAVTYATGGANVSGMPSTPPQVHQGSQHTISPTEPTRTNYTFAGWTIFGQTGTFLAGDSITVSTATTITAQWNPVMLNLTWNLDGGTLVSGANPVTIQQGSVVSMPTVQKPGYTFDGWERTPSAAINAPISEATTFTAIWVPLPPQMFGVTWNLNNGAWANGFTTPATSVAENTVLSLPTASDLTRTNYTFGGWTRNVGGLNDPITATTIFTAQWNPIMLTITWDRGDGQWTDTIAAQIRTTSVQQGSTPTAPNQPSKTNYTFDGWSPNITTVTGAQTYVAQFVPLMHTISWNLDNGSWVLPFAPITTLQQGQMLSLPLDTNLTRPNHSFAGWTVNGVNTSESSITISGTTNIAARWDIDQHIVTWDANGGEWTDSAAAQTRTTLVNHGALPVIPNNPVWAGAGNYFFAGWQPTLTAINEPQTFTAIWNAAPPTEFAITWNPSGGSWQDTGLSSTRTTNVVEGQLPTPPSTLTRENYTFGGWTPIVVAVTGTQVYTADWNPIMYTITWDNANGTWTDATATQERTTQVQRGNMPVAPNQPTRTGYIFDGWSPTLSAITGEATFVATWVTDPNVAPPPQQPWPDTPYPPPPPGWNPPDPWPSYPFPYESPPGWQPGDPWPGTGTEPSRLQTPPNKAVKNGVLSWDLVSGAMGYAIIVNGEVLAEVLSNQLYIGHFGEGTFEIQIIALSSDTTAILNSYATDALSHVVPPNGPGSNPEYPHLPNRLQTPPNVHQPNLTSVAWDAVPNAERYAVYLNGTRIAHTEDTSFSLSGFGINGGTYVISVRAIPASASDFSESLISLGKIVTLNHDLPFGNALRNVPWWLWTALGAATLLALLLAVAVVAVSIRNRGQALATIMPQESDDEAQRAIQRASREFSNARQQVSVAKTDSSHRDFAATSLERADEAIDEAIRLVKERDKKGGKK